MLSTSYEAIYALDNLRSRSNLNKNQIALLIDCDASTYRVAVNKMERGEVVGLNGLIDTKVRYGIALLIYGLQMELLPLAAGKTSEVKYEQRNAIDLLESTFYSIYRENKVSKDPTGYIAARRNSREQSIPTEVLIDHAKRFTGLAS